MKANPCAAYAETILRLTTERDEAREEAAACEEIRKELYDGVSIAYDQRDAERSAALERIATLLSEREAVDAEVTALVARLTENVHALSRALGIPDVAEPISPQEAFERRLAMVLRLRNFVQDIANGDQPDPEVCAVLARAVLVERP